MLVPAFSSLACVAAVVFLLAQVVTSAVKNVTIDDTKGDELSGVVPDYAPVSGWSAGPTRWVTLDPSQVHLGTWHDSTAHADDPLRQISFSFTGVALYVFCIITNNPHPDTLPFDRLASYTFTLDGQDAGSYRHVPDPNTPNYDYNTLVFSKDGLSNEAHNFKLQLDPSQGTVLILFDYAMYTVSTSDEPSPQSSPPPVTSPSSTPPNSPSPSPTITPLSSTQSLPRPQSDPLLTLSSISSIQTSSSSIPSPASNSTANPAAGASAIGAQPVPSQPGSPSLPGPTDAPSSTHKTTNLGAIIGGVLGGLALLTLLALFFWISRRHTKARRNTIRPERDPLVTRSLHISTISSPDYTTQSSERLTPLEKRKMVSIPPSTSISSRSFRDEDATEDGVTEEINELRMQVRNLRLQQLQMQQMLVEPPPHYDG